MTRDRFASWKPRNARTSRRGVATRPLLEPLEPRALLTSIIDLGPGEAYAINNSGQVAGTTASGQAFLYSGGQITDLGIVPGYTSSDGRGINDSGQVVGTLSGNKYGTDGAFLYSRGTGMIALGAQPSVDSQAFGINDSGQVVGYGSTAGSASAGFLYTESTGGWTDLGNPPGYLVSEAFAISNSGQILADASAAGSGYSAEFLYNESTGAWTALGDADAYAINNSGQVVGDFYDAAAGEIHAFLSSPGTGMIDLGTPQGGLYSMASGSSLAYGINNSGQVVGDANVVYGDGHSNDAFFYGAQTGMVNLNSLLPPGSGWGLEFANAINDHGQIVGQGYNPEGEQDAFLLQLGGQSQGPAQPANVTGMVSAGQNKKGLIGVTVVFDEALDGNVVNDRALFKVLGAVKKQHKTVYTQAVHIKALSFDGQTRVTIKLAKPYKGAVKVTVLAGIPAADGASSASAYSAVVD